MTVFPELIEDGKPHQREMINYPRLTMTGQRWDKYGCPHTAIEVVMGLDLIPRSQEILEQLKAACNATKNQLEGEGGGSFFYEVNFRSDIRRGLPGYAIYIYYSNTRDLPPEGVAGREHRVLPRFTAAIEAVLADFRP